ncbi:MAG: DedA family protein [Melioribacteraceae bacterium]|nr:DedA family protein [Melioribacteraceae bacterium]MCF8265264.1 DedA family protein [Melioribacteraceae bacterium]MCF8414166.1 DedA family protein [Melioribacteraceae bacterium]
MFEEILTNISGFPPVYLYMILFFFAFIENLFPPSPSDVVIILGASVFSDSFFGLGLALIISSLGSSLGFITMYYIGFFLSEKVLRSDKMRFVNKKAMKTVDEWFRKYGYKLIVINRFLPGTRAVVSFFCGVHELKPYKTFVLASVSSLLWYVLLVYGGYMVGHNIDKIDYYLSTYSTIILFLTLFIALILGVRYLIVKRKSKIA